MGYADDLYVNPPFPPPPRVRQNPTTHECLIPPSGPLASKWRSPNGGSTSLDVMLGVLMTVSLLHFLTCLTGLTCAIEQ